jgi:hypothetical protein
MYKILVALSLISLVSCANPGEPGTKLVVVDDPLQLFEGQITEQRVSINNLEVYENLDQYYDILSSQKLKNMLENSGVNKSQIDLENTLIELGATSAVDFYNGMAIYLSPYDFLDHSVTMRVDENGKFFAYLPTLKSNLVNYRIFAYNHVPISLTNLVTAEKTSMCLEFSAIKDVKNAIDTIYLNTFIVELLKHPCPVKREKE